jgi:signal transduction histidine kinase
VFIFIVMGPLMSAMLSPFAGLAVMHEFKLISSAEVHSAWLTWWLANAVGILVLVPLVIAWRSLPKNWARAKLVEGLVVFGLLALAGQLVFGAYFDPGISRYPLSYVTLPLVGWAAFRFGKRGATLGTALLTGFAAYGTVNGIGAFAQGTLTESVLLLQTFVGVVGIAALVLAAVVEERSRHERALQNANESLEQRVADRTMELRALSARLQSVREEERSRIAREIHDELGQSLTALKMELSWLAKQLPASQPGLRQKARQMNKAIDSTIGSVRKIATELRPSVLDHLGLFDALEWLLGDFQEKTEIECSSQMEVAGVEVDAASSTELFRVVQEALTNVARHAQATKVHLSVGARGGGLRLELRDNGRGFDACKAGSRGSMGFVGMRERVNGLGGTVEVRAAPGQGTTVTVFVPLPRTRRAG